MLGLESGLGVLKDKLLTLGSRLSTKGGVGVGVYARQIAENQVLGYAPNMCGWG